MAKRKKLSARGYIDINGEKVLWWEIPEGGKIKWFLPPEQTEAIKQAMLENIGRNMSRYAQAHPESALWNKDVS